jgi:glyoxylase-like metal-dependent hydrolase (beta-lactamase superfamily II)
MPKRSAFREMRQIMLSVDNVCYRFKIGLFDCLALRDSSVGSRRRLFAGSVLNGLAGEEYLDERPPTTSYPAPRACLLIRAPGLCVLIDTGTGLSADNRNSGRLLQSITLAGISAHDVDTVILTHAHRGHAGGTLDVAGRPIYTEARYVLAADEWDFWMSRPDLRSRRLQRMADTIHTGLSALQGRVTLLTGGDWITSGIRAIATPGHSAGHIAISISSEGQELLCIGDTALAPIHLQHPAWYSRFDLRPEQAATTRVRLLDQAAASGALVHAYHFPFPGLGWIYSGRQAWRWEPIPERSPNSSVGNRR